MRVRAGIRIRMRMRMRMGVRVRGLNYLFSAITAWTMRASSRSTT